MGINDEEAAQAVRRGEEKGLYGYDDPDGCGSADGVRRIPPGFTKPGDRNVCSRGNFHRYLSGVSGGVASELIVVMENQLANNKDAIAELQKQTKQIENSLSRLKELHSENSEPEQ